MPFLKETRKYVKIGGTKIAENDLPPQRFGNPKYVSAALIRDEALSSESFKGSMSCQDTALSPSFAVTVRSKGLLM